MTESSVNNLNGVPNFGHGLPEDGIVIAGVTDVPQSLPDLAEPNMDDNEEKVEGQDVPAEESPAETDNG